jgi:hypothetical protein
MLSLSGFFFRFLLSSHDIYHALDLSPRFLSLHRRDAHTMDERF